MVVSTKRRYGRSVNVPFSGLLPEILDRTKIMTTRMDENDYYYGTFLNFDPDKFGIPDPRMHMFWRSPRTRNPECYKIGIVNWSMCCRKTGREFTEQDALWDGFCTIDQYIEALGIHNHMSYWEVLDYEWTQLVWDRDGWIEGPHRPPLGSPAYRHLMVTR
jgi:hypothetical protein